MTKQLICEGHCNPRRRDLDARVHDHRKAFSDDSGAITPVQDDLAADLRTLLHTPHLFARANHQRELWTCGVCGTSRVYGAA